MIVMGDFNGHIEGWYSNHTNTNGQALIDFAEYWELEILPNNQPTFRGRNGDPTCVDYVLIPRNMNGYIKGHAVYSDSAISSDHIPLITQVLPTPDMTRKPRRNRLRTHQLRDPKIAKKFQEELALGLAALN